MKRWVSALTFILATSVASVALGQDIQLTGPLAGAPSCRHCVEYRRLRLEAGVGAGMTLQDEFNRTVFLTERLQFHFNEIVAFGVFGAEGLTHLNTSLTDQITTQTTATTSTASANACNSTPSSMCNNIPNGANFPRQLGTIDGMLAPELILIPLRGKISLFQSIFIDTDFYIFGGAAFVWVSERANFDASNPMGTTIAQNQTARSQRIAVTGTFGAGLNFYITHFLSLQFEYRAFPFSWNEAGTDENSNAMTCGTHAQPMSCAGFPDYQVAGHFVLNGNDQTFHFNQMVNLTVNLFLPPSAHIGE